MTNEGRDQVYILKISIHKNSACNYRYITYPFFLYKLSKNVTVIAVLTFLFNNAAKYCKKLFSRYNILRLIFSFKVT